MCVCVGLYTYLARLIVCDAPTESSGRAANQHWHGKASTDGGLMSFVCCRICEYEYDAWLYSKMFHRLYKQFPFWWMVQRTVQYCSLYCIFGRDVCHFVLCVFMDVYRRQTLASQFSKQILFNYVYIHVLSI